MALTRSRRWCFTLNNYSEEHELAIQDPDNRDITFIIYGREVCPTTGTPHLQGFFILKNPKSLGGIRGCLPQWGWPGTIHLEQTRGSVGSNIDYCSKFDRVPFRRGEEPKQGSRTDLQEVAERIEQGQSLQEIAEGCPTEFIKFGRGISSLIALRAPPRSEKTKVIWCWGATGTGKTRWCNDTYPNGYWKDGSTKWWDGYAGQDAVIIDDFRPSKELSFVFLLRLFDRYALSVEVKGGYVNFSSSVICVTSPRPPEEVFDKLEWLETEDKAQIYRRIDEIKHFATL